MNTVFIFFFLSPFLLKIVLFLNIYTLFKNQFNDFFVILAISIINSVGTAVLPCSYALITEWVVFNFVASFSCV